MVEKRPAKRDRKTVTRPSPRPRARKSQRPADRSPRARTLTRYELETMVELKVLVVLDQWLAEGRGVAVYLCADPSHPGCGSHFFHSYGTPEASFPTGPPAHLDVWHRLVGTYSGDEIGV
jgi:hypothetical protein